MILKRVSEAKTELSSLIEVVRKREDSGAISPRIPGSLAGQIDIDSDFDAQLPDDIAEAFGAG